MLWPLEGLDFTKFTLRTHSSFTSAVSTKQGLGRDAEFHSQTLWKESEFSSENSIALKQSELSPVPQLNISLVSN